MACVMCGESTKPRPVLTRVRDHRNPGKTIEKRVHMKPVQLVIAAHFHAVARELAEWEGIPKRWAGLEVCASCLDGKSAGEVLAVWLDHELEDPASPLNAKITRRRTP